MNKKQYEQTTMSFDETDQDLREKLEGSISIIDTWRIGAAVALKMGVKTALERYCPTRNISQGKSV